MDETPSKDTISVITHEEDEADTTFSKTISECCTDINLQSGVILQRKVTKTEKFSFSNFKSESKSVPTLQALSAFVRQELEINRCIKRMQKACRHRGVSITKKTLISDASKDTFDMRNLSAALPSTSNAEKISALHSISEVRRMRERPPKMIMPKKLSSSGKKPSVGSSSKEQVSKGNQRKFSPLPSCTGLDCFKIGTEYVCRSKNCKRKKALKKGLARIHARFMKTQKIFLKPKDSCLKFILRPLEASKKPPSTCRPLEASKKPPSTCRPLEASKQLNFCPEFAKMSLDDEQEGSTTRRRNSDVENKQQMFRFPPLPKLGQEAGLFSLDTDESQTANYLLRQVPAPFNSPDGKNADQNVSINKAFERIKLS